MKDGFQASCESSAGFPRDKMGTAPLAMGSQGQCYSAGPSFTLFC